MKNIDFRLAPFKKGTWQNYTYLDGLADNDVIAIHRDDDGILWFGTWGGGVSRYDGSEFKNFTTEDGLGDNFVTCIHTVPNGTIWFGTKGGGVSRYDGKTFLKLTPKDGLAHYRINVIHHDPDGMMWFGTEGGLSRYDGKEFNNFTTKDGLVNNNVSAIHRETSGLMEKLLFSLLKFRQNSRSACNLLKGLRAIKRFNNSSKTNMGLIFPIKPFTNWFATSGKPS